MDTGLAPPKYTEADYLESEKPYAELYALRNNQFLHEQKLGKMIREADRVGFKRFNAVYRAFIRSRENPDEVVGAGNFTEFSGQPRSLDTGEWIADDFGVRRGAKKEDEACCHPIMPVARLVNIDTGLEKLKIAYSRGRKWREIIVDRSQLASPQKIVSLSDSGIAVNSENARQLIQYLHDVEKFNYDRIPEKKSITRLGYIRDEGFSPYVDGLIFDGDASYRSIFESIRCAGDRQKWMDLALKIRRSNVMARIVLAASFASVLVAPVGGLPFFVHLWAGESGSGKTVALMLAASVWGCPEMGRYIQTFNSSVVGREQFAAFLNHLPMLIDELQLAKDARGKNTFDVYGLAEGVGKTRSNRTLGINRTSTWANCIITTGESPITATGAGAGAINRVIEIEGKTAAKIIEDGHEAASVLKKNYGFVGREFVDRLYADGESVEKACSLYRMFFRDLSSSDTTEKQAMAAAIILAADVLATDWIFHDGQALTGGEISKFLASRSAVSAGVRGYEYMCQWVVQNINKFDKKVETGEIYGVVEDSSDSKKVAYIIKSVFRKAAEDAGFSASALLSHLKENGLILTRGRNLTRGKRIKGTIVECVALLMNDAEDEDGLPFGPGEVA